MNATRNCRAPKGSSASLVRGVRAALLTLLWIFSVAALPAWAAPAAPATVSALTGNTETTLSWSGSPGAQWYLLYRGSESGHYQFVARTRGLSHSDHGLTNGQPYHYVVTALDATGESGYSAQVTVRTNSNVLPAPTQLEARAGNGQASLSWTPVTSAQSYRVYRSTSAGGPYSALEPPAPGPSFTDSGLVNGTRYYYVVQTLSTDAGSFSDELPVTPSAELPAAPGNLTATPGSGWASLTWDAAPEATGYTVYRGSAVGGPYQFQGFTPTTGYEDIALSNGTSYYYVVTASNAKGEGAFSSERSAAVSDIEMPHAAKLRGSLSDTGSIILDWDHPYGAVSYRLSRATTPGGPYTSLGIRERYFANTGLVNGTTYYYVLDSLNGSPVSERSNELALAPVAGGVPPVPGSVAAQAGNTMVTLTWTPVPGVTSYDVVVSTVPGGPDVGGYRYTDGDACLSRVQELTNGVTYFFRVRAAAYNWSGYSAEVSATPSELLPVGPEQLTVVNGNGEVSLTWPPAPGATSYQLPGVPQDQRRPLARRAHSRRHRHPVQRPRAH